VTLPLSRILGFQVIEEFIEGYVLTSPDLRTATSNSTEFSCTKRRFGKAARDVGPVCFAD